MTYSLIIQRYSIVLYWTILTKILVRRSLSRPIWYLVAIKSHRLSYSINLVEQCVLELKGPILN